MRRLAAEHEVLITVEEGSIGGFATQVMHFLSTHGIFDAGLRFRPMVMPDAFLDQDVQQRQVQIAGLSAPNIVVTALAAIGVGGADASVHGRA